MVFGLNNCPLWIAPTWLLFSPLRKSRRLFGDELGIRVQGLMGSISISFRMVRSYLGMT